MHRTRDVWNTGRTRRFNCRVVGWTAGAVTSGQDSAKAYDLVACDDNTGETVTFSLEVPWADVTDIDLWAAIELALGKRIPPAPFHDA